LATPLVATARDHAPTTCTGLSHHLAQQARFANARLAGEQQDGVTVASEEALNSGQFTCAAYKDRTVPLSRRRLLLRRRRARATCGRGKRCANGAGEVKSVSERFDGMGVRKQADASFEVGDRMDPKPTQRSEAFLRVASSQPIATQQLAKRIPSWRRHDARLLRSQKKRLLLPLEAANDALSFYHFNQSQSHGNYEKPAVSSVGHSADSAWPHGHL
jgi:hypothetical protein